MVRGHDVVVISSVDWGPLWQVHQELAKRLARKGSRVVFIENTGVRAPGASDVGRVIRRARDWAGAARSGGLRRVAPDVYACAPLVLPPFGSRVRRVLNRRVLLPLVRRALRPLGLRDPVIITFLPTDTARRLLEMLRTPRSVTVYYCAADFSALVPRPADIQRSERELIEGIDLVLAIGTELGRRCREWSDAVHMFPPGVDLGAFPPREPPAPTPPGPVIGYVGGLHRHVDRELLVEMARRRPEWAFVFVGPLQHPCDELAEFPNVYLRGPRPHGELASYIAGFDACIVPYLLTDATATVVPTKVNEYLAMGKPVVSTDLPSLRELGPHEGVTIAGRDPNEFLAALDEALAAAPDKVAAARRRRHAARSDWSHPIAAMSDLIDAAAGPR